MKVEKIIVDEIPKTCGECYFNNIIKESLVCYATNKFIRKNRRSMFCPLELNVEEVEKDNCPCEYGICSECQNGK